MKSNNKKPGDNNICAICDYAELYKIRDFVLMNANRFGFSEDDSNNIALAVDEACSNLIRYAFNFDKSKEFCVQIETDINQFIVNILDTGEPFNPLDVERPDMLDYIKKYNKGGLGIHLMRSVMDEVSYLPSNESSHQNILKLKKALIVS